MDTVLVPKMRRVSLEIDCRIVTPALAGGAREFALSTNEVLIFPLNPFDFNRERYSSALPHNKRCSTLTKRKCLCCLITCAYKKSDSTNHTGFFSPSRTIYSPKCAVSP
jgi:hypothetical protein